MPAKVISYPTWHAQTGERIAPLTIECRCGQPLELWSSWANECPTCHVEYNGSGQELAPRELWGEETGEQF